MKLLKRIRILLFVVSVTTLLLFAGSSPAQNANPKVWGKAVEGLQMRIYLDQAAGGPSKVPKFRVELRNAGQNDLLLNLGIMARDGRQQCPNAVSLILVDAQGVSQRLELKRSLPVSDAERETLYLPLPVGATFSFPVDLDNYWAVTSKELNYKLKPGTYRLAAHLDGFVRTGPPYPVVPVQTPGQPPILPVHTFDTVNPETGLGPPPISNTLKFEVPIR